MAKRTFASVTEAPCTCRFLDELAADPGSPIKFDVALNEFHFEYDCPPHGKGSLLIYHCPFCGGAAPESQRDKFFAVISQVEEERLFTLMREVKTIGDAIRILGTPDFDLPHGAGSRQPERDGEPPTAERLRTLIYSKLSDVAEVRLTVYPNNSVHIALQGKYLGEPNSAA